MQGHLCNGALSPEVSGIKAQQGKPSLVLGDCTCHLYFTKPDIGRCNVAQALNVSRLTSERYSGPVPTRPTVTKTQVCVLPTQLGSMTRIRSHARGNMVQAPSLTGSGSGTHAWVCLCLSSWHAESHAASQISLWPHELQCQVVSGAHVLPVQEPRLVTLQLLAPGDDTEHRFEIPWQSRHSVFPELPVWVRRVRLRHVQDTN